MSTKIRLVPLKGQTCFAPLAVLGYCLTRTRFLSPVFAELDLSLKTVDHAPSDKLLDILVSILAGCRCIQQVNTRLRPDLALAQAWGRKRFAEQSSLARTLDAFTDRHLQQLRQGSQTLFRRESLALQHDFSQDWLWLDIDLTPLPASKYAEASTKGNLGKKIATVGSSLECMRLNIRKRSFRTCSQAQPPAFPPTSRSFKAWINF
jgi:hypothetical protein